MSRPAIQPRNLEFPIGDDVPNLWHGGDPHVTHFFNGLSLMFPDGERFFMDAVRHFKDEVHDPKLQTDVRAFCGQEGIHAREHGSYNDWLEERGYPARRLERIVQFRVAMAKKMPWKFQLALTCALEHFTAILADAFLGDPRVTADVHPAMKSLWKWHAMEETEHKAVAFDVYKTIAPGFGGYLRRIWAMVTVTLLFTLQIVIHQVLLEAREGVLWRIRGRGHAFRFFWTEPGFLRQAMRSYLAYYRPSFHPWDHDNSKLVEAWKAEYAAAS
jgi:uncharacterized protein